MSLYNIDSLTPADFKNLTAEQCGLPNRLRLEGIRPSYEYDANGKRLDNIVGYKYTVTKLGGTKTRRTFDTFVSGKPLFDPKEFEAIEHEVFVSLEGFNAHFYKKYDDNFNVSYMFKSEAKRIKVIDEKNAVTDEAIDILGGK